MNATSHYLPQCGICAPVSTSYRVYNVVVAAILEPFIGFLGLVGNSLAVLIYSRPTMRSSMNFYLCALAVSDMVVIITAFFLFLLLAVECLHPIIPWVYGFGTPIIYPMSMLAQTTSVYLVVAAAVDCCIVVVMPIRVRQRLCTTHTAKCISATILVLALAYNACHFFETKTIACWEEKYNDTSVKVWPTSLRQNQYYIDLYYTWMYTIIMAVGPLLSLIVINTFIIGIIYLSNRRRASELASNTSSEDTITLVLVVFMFIFCNSLALVINFLEKHSNITPDLLSYLVDVSNLLVVFNSSCNFFIYYAFGESFRKTLKYYFGQKFGDMYICSGLVNQTSSCRESQYRKTNQSASVDVLTADTVETPMITIESSTCLTRNGVEVSTTMNSVRSLITDDSCLLSASSSTSESVSIPKTWRSMYLPKSNSRAPLAIDECNGIPLTPIISETSTPCSADAICKL